MKRSAQAKLMALMPLLAPIALAIVSLLGSGCGEDSPTVPVAFPPQDIAGTWRGADNLVSITGCESGFFESREELDQDVVLTITQDAAGIAGEVVRQPSGQSCPLAGSVDNRSVFWREKDCNPPQVRRDVTCQGPRICPNNQVNCPDFEKEPIQLRRSYATADTRKFFGTFEVEQGRLIGNLEEDVVLVDRDTGAFVQNVRVFTIFIGRQD